METTQNNQQVLVDQFLAASDGRPKILINIKKIIRETFLSQGIGGTPGSSVLHIASLLDLP